MSQTSRVTNPDQKVVYHVVAKTAPPDLLFGDVEKAKFDKLLKHLSFSKVYLVTKKETG